MDLQKSLDNLSSYEKNFKRRIAGKIGDDREVELAKSLSNEKWKKAILEAINN